MKPWAVISLLCALGICLFLPAVTQAATADTGNGTVLAMRRDQDVANAFPCVNAGYNVITTAGTKKVNGIDFTKEELLTVSMGMQMTGGSTITITEVHEFDTRLVVAVTAKTPGFNGAVTQTITCPSDTAIIPKSDKPVFFSVETFMGDKSAGVEVHYPILADMHGTTTKTTKTETLVVKDGKAWAELWQVKIGSTDVPALDNTQKNKMAVAVVLGPEDANKHVAISSVVEKAGNVVVTYTLLPALPVPNGGMVGPNAQPTNVTTPSPITYAVAIIPTTTAKITFDRVDMVAAPGKFIGPPGTGLMR